MKNGYYSNSTWIYVFALIITFIIGIAAVVGLSTLVIEKPNGTQCTTIVNGTLQRREERQDTLRWVLWIILILAILLFLGLILAGASYGGNSGNNGNNGNMVSKQHEYWKGKGKNTQTTLQENFSIETTLEE